MRLVALLATVIVACSAADPDPLVEYPDPPAAALPIPAEDAGAAAPPADLTPDAAAPISGKRLLDKNVMLEGRTTDGHLVLFVDDDLAVWPVGAPAPVIVAAAYDFGFDSRLTRGRFVGAWLGESPGATPLVLWSQKGGVETVAPLSFRDAIYPRPSSDEFAYLTPGAGILHRHVRATTAGSGAGTLVVENLDSGVTRPACRPTVTYAGERLVVAGCTARETIPRVATYATDGSGTISIVLEASAPGLWVNRAGTRALVQTSETSQIRALTGSSPPLPLDTPVRQAFFSADDAKVVYLRPDGKVRGASTSAPAAPLDLLDDAVAVLRISNDARYVVAASSGDPSRGESNLLVVDATSPGAPRTLATEKAALVGLSRSGDRVVYLANRGTLLSGQLEVAVLPDGAPVRLSENAERVVFDGDVVYWQEYVKAKKANVLKAARVTAPEIILSVDEGLDPLTAHAVIAGEKLFVGSKLGLWEYPALAP
jgi:hypothetical protein